MKSIVPAVLFLLGSAHGALAQSALPSRVFIVVNGGYQLTANDFSDGAVKVENAEDGHFNVTYPVSGGPAFDIAGGVQLWRWFGIGLGVNAFSVSTPVSLTATIPHPFFFSRARSVSGNVAGLEREEHAIHAQVRGVFPIGTRFQVMAFGGPSYFSVKQGIVTDFTYGDTYPYDEAQFVSALTTIPSESKVGFNVGGDLSFFFVRQVGLGLTMQFSRATVEAPGASGANQRLEVGGGGVGGGLRLRF